MRKRDIIHTIKQAFSEAPMPRPEEIMEAGADALAPDSEEDQAIVARVLAGKKWQKLTVADIAFLYSSLSMMTPQAVRYYLPAYLIASIKDPAGVGVSLSTTIWDISPPPFGTSSQEEFDARIAPITPAERKAICQYFEYVRRTESFIVQFSGEEPHEYLTGYWQQYCCKSKTSKTALYRRRHKPGRKSEQRAGVS